MSVLVVALLVLLKCVATVLVKPIFNLLYLVFFPVDVAKVSFCFTS